MVRYFVTSFCCKGKKQFWDSCIIEIKKKLFKRTIFEIKKIAIEIRDKNNYDKVLIMSFKKVRGNVIWKKLTT